MHVPVLAKIEHPVALENLDSILNIADAVMVARGDLGVEIPLENVPVVQQQIIDKALERGMPVIVATQMLDSMTFQPRPTRAEVSDVSTAIRHGATGVMLSGETASGTYPLETVETMARIVKATEEGLGASNLRPTALARFRSTRRSPMQALSLLVRRGPLVSWWPPNTGPRLGWFPATAPKSPVTAVSDRLRALRRTCLLPGVDAILPKNTTEARKRCEKRLNNWLSRGASSQGTCGVHFRQSTGDAGRDQYPEAVQNRRCGRYIGHGMSPWSPKRRSKLRRFRVAL